MLAATVSNDDNGATAVGATAASVAAADGGSGSKPAAVLLTVGGGTNDGASLQDSFLKFKQQRARTLKMQREKRARDLKDPKRKEKLRAKFLERVRSYMGVPYAQKYHEPGTKDYDAPLFLDCCGLVRRAMDDLQEEFGFRIGRWNQAYMFDVLPTDVPFEELKPGDLIFYSGTFTRKNAKKQKHNMVHVEVFIGGESGEETIGARWQKGHVQVHSSYKFKSKNYTDVKHYFKSLEPWLSGECKSHCAEHDWEIKGFSKVDSAKSVFFDDDAGEAADDGSVEAESGEDEEEGGAGTATAAAGSHSDSKK